MNAAREMVAKVERVSAALGLREAVVARMYDGEAREAAAEERKREAERVAAVEAAQDAVWAHQHANVEMGLPEGTTMAERLALLYPEGRETPRDPSAPYGSAGNPAFLVSTADGGLIDIGYQRKQSAQRSFADAHDDSLLKRAKELREDSFMAVQRSQYHSRCARRAQRAAPAPAPATERAEYETTGTGWPEIVR